MKLSRSWALLLLWLPNALCVDHSKFRTCSQTNFCVRKRTAEPGRSYLVGPQSVSLSSNALTAELHGGPWGVPLTLQLFAYDTGVARMRITESKPLHGPRWEPDDILLDQAPHGTALTQLAADAAPGARRGRRGQRGRWGQFGLIII